MPLTAAHKAKIAAGMRAYHAKCKACHAKDDDAVKRGRRKRLYPKSAAATALAKATRKGPLKRLRRAGTQAKPKPAAKKKPRRVKLTTVPRPARKNPRFMQSGESGGRSRTAGQRYMDNRVKGIKKKAKKLRGKDAAPEWAFSIKDRWAMDSAM